METAMKLYDLLDNVLLVAVGIGWIAAKIKEILRRKKPSSLDQSLKIDQLLYPILWDLLGRFGAGRVYIVQFHNGSNYYTHQSIQRKTVSHEVAIKLPKLKANFDNVLISEMTHKILVSMLQGDYYNVDSIYDLDQNDDLVNWMNVYGVRALYYFRIVDKKGNTVAMLNMHWPHTEPLKAIDVEYILEAKKGIESIFNKLT
jgi:hypothetical protein